MPPWQIWHSRQTAAISPSVAEWPHAGHRPSLSPNRPRAYEVGMAPWLSALTGRSPSPVPLRLTEYAQHSWACWPRWAGSRSSRSACRILRNGGTASPMSAPRRPRSTTHLRPGSPKPVGPKFASGFWLGGFCAAPPSLVPGCSLIGLALMKAHRRAWGRPQLSHTRHPQGGSQL